MSAALSWPAVDAITPSIVPTRTRPKQEYLRAKTTPKNDRPFVVYDIESKADVCSCKGPCKAGCGVTQEAGFTRPFLVGVLAPATLWKDDAGYGRFKMFQNVASTKTLPWDRRHDAPGGCIDQLLRYLFEELPRQLNEEGASPFRGLTIYAHNGGNFDHQFVLRWLLEHSDAYEWEVIPVQSSIQEIQVKRRGDKKPLWFFRDTAKIIPLALQEACRSLGVKGKLEHDLQLHEDDPRWESYLRQDCIALVQVMDRFIELVEVRLGGEVGLTAAATSMNLFRRKYLKYKIPRHAHFGECSGFLDDGPSSDEASDEALEGLSLLTEPEACPGCCHEFVRSAYFGGRTEIFNMQGENLHYYDINSSYVRALCEPMPAGERFVEEGKISWNMAEAYVGFARCTVWIPKECEIPPLPWVDPETGKLTFQTGLLTGTWDTSELALLDHPRVKGKILRVERVVWIRAKVIARDMMLDLFKLRDKSLPGFDEGLSLIAKLLGNSLYGKFGQRRERTSIVRAEDVPRAGGICFLCKANAGEGLEICRSCEGSKPCGPGGNETDADFGLWYRRKEVDPAYVIPQIAAHVTALARIRLFHFMMEALDLGGRIFMVDTDSVITDVVLPTSSELGALKDEFPGKLLWFMAVQPKVYCLEFMEGGVFAKTHMPKPLCPATHEKECPGCATSKVTMKGFKKDERTKENILRLAASLEAVKRGEKPDYKVTFKNPQKVRSLAAAGFRGSPRVVTIEKGFQSLYDKRQLFDDGSTRPHHRHPGEGSEEMEMVDAAE